MRLRTWARPRGGDEVANTDVDGDVDWVRTVADAVVGGDVDWARTRTWTLWWWTWGWGGGEGGGGAWRTWWTDGVGWVGVREARGVAPRACGATASPAWVVVVGVGWVDGDAEDPAKASPIALKEMAVAHWVPFC